MGLGGGGWKWAARVAWSPGFFRVAAGVDVFQNAFSTWVLPTPGLTFVNLVFIQKWQMPRDGRPVWLLENRLGAGRSSKDRQDMLC